MEIKFWNTYDTRKTFHQKNDTRKSKIIKLVFKVFFVWKCNKIIKILFFI
jgi:hypothetical protein